MTNFYGRADLHLHSKYSDKPAGFFSSLINCPESYTEPKEIYERLKRRGMNFVTITDHNVIDGCLEIAHLEDVFISCEYTVLFPEDKKAVHILCYGITEKDHEELTKLRDNIYDFKRYLKLHRITHSLAHPLYSVDEKKISKEHLDKFGLLFDIWEAINGTRSEESFLATKKIASFYDKKNLESLANIYNIEPLRENEEIGFSAGSDDHGGLDLGFTYTEADFCITKEEFLKALKEGKTQVFTKELKTERLSNMVNRVLYLHIKKHGAIKPPISFLTDNLFLCYQNLEKSFEEIHEEIFSFKKEIIKSALNNFKSFKLENLPENIGNLVISFCLSLPYIISSYHRSKEKNESIRALESFGKNLEQKEKIAYITDTFYEVNGVAKTTRELSHIALEENMPFTFIYPGDTNEEKENLLEIKSDLSFDNPFYKTIPIRIVNLIDILRVFEAKKFTKVHISTPGPFGLMSFLAAKILGLPVYSAFHTDFVEYAYIYLKSEETKELIKKALVIFHNSTEKVLVPSYHYFEKLREWGVKEEKLFIFKRGVNTEKFSPYKRDLNFWKSFIPNYSEKSKIILYVGRVSKEKNIDTILNVAKMLENNEKNIKFVIVGDGPDLETYRDIAPKNVYFTGFLHGEDLAKAYASSDIFFFPSKTETYGNVILEAFASGLPAIVSDKGASKEHVKHFLNGFICKDEGDFYSRITYLLNNSSIMNSFSKEAIKTTIKLDYKKLYKEMLKLILSKKDKVYA